MSKKRLMSLFNGGVLIAIKFRHSKMEDKQKHVKQWADGDDA